MPIGFKQKAIHIPGNGQCLPHIIHILPCYG
jgi:hypothetical protein